ncbi:hypothetical protein Tco_1177125, partial [Tanacetum coccineum]
KYNFIEDNSWSQIIFENIYNTFLKDEAEVDEEAELAKDDNGKGKVNDKGKEKVDDKGNGKVDDKEKRKVDDLQNRVDRLEKSKSKLVVSEKGTKKASVDLKTKEAKKEKVVEVVEVSSDEEDFSDEGFFGDEDVVLFNVVKYPL